MNQKILFSCCVRTQHENWPVTMVAVSPPLYYGPLTVPVTIYNPHSNWGGGAIITTTATFIDPELTTNFIFLFWWPASAATTTAPAPAWIQHWGLG